MEVKCVSNLCLHQENQVVDTKMHGLDGLGEAEATAIPDIVSSQVYPWGVGQLLQYRYRVTRKTGHGL